MKFKILVIGLMLAHAATFYAVGAQADSSASSSSGAPATKERILVPAPPVHGEEALTLLDELYAKTNEKIVAMEVADELLKQVRRISLGELSDEQADKMMKVYKTVSSVYADNARFKSAYLVFNEYIGLKDALLMRRRKQRIEKVEIETSKLKDDYTLNISANDDEITTLRNENDSLLSAKQNVYRTIWIVVILVAFFSGAVIWYINSKYTKAKQLLAANHKRMMDVVFTSSIGEFSEGLLCDNENSYLSRINKVKGRK